MQAMEAQWHLQMLPQLRAEMEQLGLLSPILWVPEDRILDICFDKLVDMLRFAPTDMDVLVGSMTALTRNVLLRKVSYPVALKSLTECRDFLSGSEEPLVKRYWLPLKHLVDTTWVLLTCLHRGRSVVSVAPGVLGGLSCTRDMSLANQSALAAAKSITLQLCHYAQWPRLMDERGPLFCGAVEAAALALRLYSGEGVWIALYARCLSWRHPDKAVLLHGAARLSHSPFCVVELATLLANSSNSKAVDIAAQLIENAVSEWPHNIFVNTSYVTLLLTSNCRSLLSMSTAQMCLERARAHVPDSPLLSGYAWSLHDIQRAGGQLSPILEEGDEEVFGCWDSDKEKRLRNIADKLHPDPVDGERLDEMTEPRSKTLLWSPRAATRKTSSPTPPPAGIPASDRCPTATNRSPTASPPSRRRCLRTEIKVRPLRMPSTTPQAVASSGAHPAQLALPTAVAPSAHQAASSTGAAAVRQVDPLAGAPAVRQVDPLAGAPAVRQVDPLAGAPAVRQAAPSEGAPVVRQAAPSEGAPVVRQAASSEGAPVVRQAASSEGAPAVRQAATLEGAPAGRPAAPSLGAPVGRPAAPSLGAPVGRPAAPSLGAPAGRQAAPSEGAPAVRHAAPSEGAPVVRQAASSEGAPAGRQAAPSQGAPASRQAATSECTPAGRPAALSQGAPAGRQAAASAAFIAVQQAATSAALSCSSASGSSVATRLISVPAAPPPIRKRAAVPFTLPTSIPLTPPPTPSPPREGLSSTANPSGQGTDHSVPLWRRQSCSTASEEKKTMPSTSWGLGCNNRNERMQKNKLAPVAPTSTSQSSAADKGKATVNCVCSTTCVLQTYRNFGTLRPSRGIPLFCALK